MYINVNKYTCCILCFYIDAVPVAAFSQHYIMWLAFFIYIILNAGGLYMPVNLLIKYSSSFVMCTTQFFF